MKIVALILREEDQVEPALLDAFKLQFYEIYEEAKGMKVRIYLDYPLCAHLIINLSSFVVRCHLR